MIDIELEILRDQYRVVRDEILLSIRLQALYFQISISFLAALFLASIRFLPEFNQIFYANLVVIPFLSAGFCIIWCSEYRRMRRAGDFAKEIEQKFPCKLRWTEYKRLHESEQALVSVKTIKVFILLGAGIASAIYGFTNLEGISVANSPIIFLYISALSLFTLYYAFNS